MTGARRFACLLFAVASSSVAATLFLIFEAKRGVPFRFEVELGFAVFLGLVVPLCAVALMRRVSRWQGTGSAFAAFCLTALVVGGGFGFALL